MKRLFSRRMRIGIAAVFGAVFVLTCLVSCQAEDEAPNAAVQPEKKEAGGGGGTSAKKPAEKAVAPPSGKAPATPNAGQSGSAAASGSSNGGLGTAGSSSEKPNGSQGSPQTPPNSGNEGGNTSGSGGNANGNAGQSGSAAGSGSPSGGSGNGGSSSGNSNGSQGSPQTPPNSGNAGGNTSGSGSNANGNGEQSGSSAGSGSPNGGSGAAGSSSGNPNGSQGGPQTPPNSGNAGGNTSGSGSNANGNPSGEHGAPPSDSGNEQPEPPPKPLTPSAESLDARTVRFVFRREVSEIVSLTVTPSLTLSSAGPEITNAGNGRWTVVSKFEENLKSGENYAVDGVAKNKSGKNIPFSAHFTGFNNEIPELEITEIHPMYNGKERDRKFEYIELFAKTSGNLSGLEIRGVYDKCKVKLPAVQVKAGEVIVVHLRTGGDDCVSELGDDLNVSSAPYSTPNARDLWDKNTRARLGDAADIIILQNGADDSILDAVAYAPSDAPDWEAAVTANSSSKKPETVKRIAELFETTLAGLVQEQKWTDANIRSAANSTGLTPARTLEKTSAGNAGSLWRVSGEGEETPGLRGF